MRLHICMLVVIASFLQASCDTFGTRPPVLETARAGVLDAQSAPNCSFETRPVILMRIPQVLREVSGIAVSQLHADILWMHNDSGDRANVYAVDRNSGELRGQLFLEGAEAKDWEDIAVGACASDRDESCVFVADIGDNRAIRERVEVHRLREPEQLNPDVTAYPYETMTMIYPDFPRDSEAMVVRDGVVWLFSKRLSGFEVFSHPFEAGAVVELEEVAEVDFVEAFDRLEYGVEVLTAADWSEELGAIVLRTYGRIFVFGWGAREGEGVIEALERPSFVLRPGAEFQGESITWLGNSILHVSEGRETPVWSIPCDSSAH